MNELSNISKGNIVLQLKGILQKQISVTGVFLPLLVICEGETSFEEWTHDMIFATLRNQVYLEEKDFLTNNSLCFRAIKCVIFHTQDTYFVECLSSFFINFMEKEKLPRFIAISSFLTWCKGQKCATDANEKYFVSRKSSLGTYEQFSNENIISYLRSRTFPVSILYTGLHYGGAGCDFKEFFQFLWNDESEKNSLMLSLLASDRNFPVIHIEDFAATIVNLAQSEDLPPFLNVANDSSNWNLRDVLQDKPESLKRALASISSSESGSESLSFSLHPGKIKDNILSLAAVNVNFVPSASAEKLKYPHGLRDHFSTVWSEFTQSSGLRPFKILLAGPPQAGKSFLAKELSTMLKLPVVDVLSALKYVLYADEGGTSDPATGTEFKPSPLLSLRGTLIAEIEKAVQESSGGKKKGAEVFDIKTVILSESMIGSLSPSILVEALKEMIGSNVLFQRKGFILDAWSGPLQSSEVLVALVAEAARDSSGGVDMVVELTGSDETLTQRWLVANGQDAKANVTKLPKDLQASYKIFEIALSQYKGKICDVEVSTTNSNSEDQEKIRSHEEINKMRENGVSVLRFDFLDSVVESVCSSIQEACVADTTSFGWLRASPSSLASAESSTPGVNTDLEPLAKEAVSVDVNDNSEVFTEQDIDYVRQKSKEYEDYSLATVLPTLAKVFVSIARDKPTDPLLFAIDSLSEIANRMEEVEENEARASFEAVLAASRAS